MADYDLIIIGGGPAGLTAGLYAARANMSAILLEGKDVGGEILNTDLIEDYPGFESVTGAELAQKMADHARKFGLKIETYARVKQVRVEGDRKVVELEDGTSHRAYAVIVTVGGEPVKLGVPWRDRVPRPRGLVLRRLRRRVLQGQRPRGHRRRRQRVPGGPLPHALREEAARRAPSQRLPRPGDPAGPPAREGHGPAP